MYLSVILQKSTCRNIPGERRENAKYLHKLAGSQPHRKSTFAFIMSQRAINSAKREGGTTRPFVTHGIEAALAAKAAAGDLDVKIGGGPSLSTDSRAALVAKKRHHGTAVALARLDEPAGQ